MTEKPKQKMIFTKLGMFLIGLAIGAFIGTPKNTVGYLAPWISLILGIIFILLSIKK
jgi:hypothetical protein